MSIEPKDRGAHINIEMAVSTDCFSDIIVMSQLTNYMSHGLQCAYCNHYWLVEYPLLNTLWIHIP